MRNIRSQHHKHQQHQLNRSTESIISEETTEDANSTLHIIENHQSQRHNHLRPTRLPSDQNNNINNINGNGNQVTANYNEYSESNTTTDELTDEGNFTSTNFTINNNFRDSTGFQTFNNQQTSSAEFSINTTETYTDQKSPQVSPPAKQSTPNLSNNRRHTSQSPKNKHEIRFKTKASHNNEHQFGSLLANKAHHHIAPLVDPNLESLTSGSLVSNTNLTNISPLNSINLNSSCVQPPSLTSLSPAVPLTLTKQNIYHQDNSSSTSSLQTNRNLVRPSVPPPPPHSNIPPLPSQIALRKLKANESLPTSDAESTISCQLITSSSLLLNRDFVKQASLVRLDANGRPLPPPKISHQTQTNNELFVHPSQAAENSTDAAKPPPMETCI